MWIKILAALGIVLVVAGGAFYWRYQRMAAYLSAEHDQLAARDLSATPDGVYGGRVGDFLVSAKVDVTVRDHRITDVRVVDQRAGKGHEAAEVPARIVAAQSPRVDAVSGATRSSYCIMIAADRALKDAR